MFEEFNDDALSVDQKKKLIFNYKSNSGFIWMLQMAYSPYKVFATLPKIFDEPRKKPKYNVSSLRTAIEYLIEARNLNHSEEEIAIELYDFWHQMDEEKRKILKGIVNKNLFNLNRDIINEAIGFNVIASIQIPANSVYRDDFYKRHEKWNCFGKHDGATVQIFKFGNCIEIFSKNGRPYRMFDKTRKAFSILPIDGFFNAQLYYVDDNGKENQNIFLSETAKKGQSDGYLIEIFDYSPLGRNFKYSYSDRLKFLKFLFNSIEIDCHLSIVNASAINKNQNPLKMASDNTSLLFIADEVLYDNLKPKDFLLK